MQLPFPCYCKWHKNEQMQRLSVSRGPSVKYFANMESLFLSFENIFCCTEVNTISFKCYCFCFVCRENTSLSSMSLLHYS